MTKGNGLQLECHMTPALQNPIYIHRNTDSYVLGRQQEYKGLF